MMMVMWWFKRICSCVRGNASSYVNELNLTAWDTSNVIKLIYFAAMSQLTRINFDYWNTEKVATTAAMFYNSNNLNYVNFKGLEILNTICLPVVTVSII